MLLWSLVGVWLVQDITSSSIVRQGVHESGTQLQIIIEEINSEQNFVILSDSESTLKGISNTFTMHNTSHITQMLKDKIERLECEGKNPILLISGHCGVEVNERADSEAK
jgi:hypothetical protein